MIRRPPRSTLSSSSAASDVYKRQQSDPVVPQSVASPCSICQLPHHPVTASCSSCKQPVCSGCLHHAPVPICDQCFFKPGADFAGRLITHCGWLKWPPTEEEKQSVLACWIKGKALGEGYEVGLSYMERDAGILAAQEWTFRSYMRRIYGICLLYTSPSPRDGLLSRMPSSA